MNNRNFISILFILTSCGYKRNNINYRNEITCVYYLETDYVGKIEKNDTLVGIYSQNSNGLLSQQFCTLDEYRQDSTFQIIMLRNTRDDSMDYYQIYLNKDSIIYCLNSNSRYIKKCTSICRDFKIKDSDTFVLSSLNNNNFINLTRLFVNNENQERFVEENYIYKQDSANSKKIELNLIHPYSVTERNKDGIIINSKIYPLLRSYDFINQVSTINQKDTALKMMSKLELIKIYRIQ